MSDSLLCQPCGRLKCWRPAGDPLCVSGSLHYAERCHGETAKCREDAAHLAFCNSCKHPVDPAGQLCREESRTTDMFGDTGDCLCDHAKLIIAGLRARVTELQESLTREVLTRRKMRDDMVAQIQAARTVLGWAREIDGSNYKEEAK